LVLLTLCVSTELTPVSGCSWPVSSSCSLERVCPSGLPSPISPFAQPYVPHWCSRSILATWPPHFHLRLLATAAMTSCWFSACFSTPHPVAACNTHYSPSHLPLTGMGHHLFLLHQWSCLGTTQQDREYTGFQDVFLCLQFLEFVGQCNHESYLHMKNVCPPGKKTDWQKPMIKLTLMSIKTLFVIKLGS